MDGKTFATRIPTCFCPVCLSEVATTSDFCLGCGCRLLLGFRAFYAPAPTVRTPGMKILNDRDMLKSTTE